MTRVWCIFCWCDGCNGAVCIFGDLVRVERRFPLFNAKSWSAAVGLAAVEAAVEIKQQRVEMPPL